MHVTVFTAERRLAPAASIETASSSRRILVSCIIVKESRAERPRGSQRRYQPPSCHRSHRSSVSVDSNDYPGHYSRAFAFSAILYPPPMGQPCGWLSTDNTWWRRPGLPRFTSITKNRLGPAYTPVALIVHDTGLASLYSDHLPFGHSDSAPCAAWFMTARERRFRYLDRTIHSWLPTALRLAVAV
jgi:hypothetical protein